jgi:hypothetical protein
MAATPGYVKTLATFNTSTTDPVVALTAAISRPGAQVVVFVGWTSTTVTLDGVTDAAGNTWTVEPTVTGTVHRAAICVCLNATGLGIGATITLDFSAAGGNRTGVVTEWQGIKVTGTQRDGQQSGSGAGTSGSSQAVASGNLITTNPTNLILGVVTENTTNVDTLAASGWTQLSAFTTTAFRCFPVYRVETSTGTFALSGTLSGGGTLTRAWTAAQYAFKASDLSAPRVSGVYAEVAYRYTTAATGRKRPPVQVIA